jgi:hypothetical protein
MPSQTTLRLNAPVLNDPDHNFAPDFSWAVAGGFVVLGVSALVYTLIVTWGGLRLDLALPAGEAAPLSAFPRELAGLFLSGALVVLIARSLTARTR